MDLDQDGDLDLFVGEILWEWKIDVHFNLRLHLLMDPRDWKRGQERTLTCYRSPGAGMFLVYGSFKQAHIPLPGIGLWAIDPFQMFPLGRLFVRPGEGKSSMKLRMPNDSWLKDKELFIQALFLDAKNGVKRPFLRTNRVRNRIK
ncbi:MAG TPA: hypothetical protein ENK02_14855 [Planctomycetes bacterium]|nr:hypothetical protein [Planctomycetota bacterium]